MGPAYALGGVQIALVALFKRPVYNDSTYYKEIFKMPGASSHTKAKYFTSSFVSRHKPEAVDFRLDRV
jgi:hypothetical protein